MEAEHVDVLLRLRVFNFHGGHQVDALQRPAGTVGRIGERDVPIDHGAHGAMPALGTASDGRIDDKHIDHAAVVFRRRVARRRWRGWRPGAKRVPRGLPRSQALAESRRTRLSNRGSVADGFDDVDGLGGPDHAGHELAIDREDHGARGLALDATCQRVARGRRRRALEHCVEGGVGKQVEANGAGALLLHIEPQRREPPGVHCRNPLPRCSRSEALVWPR